jgi:hypothetical protein
MCISISAEVPKINSKKIKRLQQLIAENSGLKLIYERDTKNDPTGLMWIQSREGGCGCEMLDKDAGPNDDVWLFKADVFIKLAKAVRILRSEIGNIISFYPYWKGHEIENPIDQSIDLKSFLEKIKSRHLETGMKYIIK